MCRCEGAQPAVNRAITTALVKVAAEAQQPPVAAELAQAAIDNAVDLLERQSGPSSNVQAGRAPPTTLLQDIPRLFTEQETVRTSSDKDTSEDASRSSRILEEHSHTDMKAAAGPTATMSDSVAARERQPRRTGALDFMHRTCNLVHDHLSQPLKATLNAHGMRTAGAESSKSFSTFPAAFITARTT